MSSQSSVEAHNFSCGYTYVACGAALSMLNNGITPLGGYSKYAFVNAQCCLAWGPGACDSLTQVGGSCGTSIYWDITDTSVVNFQTPNDQYSFGPNFAGVNFGSTFASANITENGCGAYGTGNPSPNVAQVSVSPPAISISSGDTSKTLSVQVNPSSDASLAAASASLLSNPSSASNATVSLSPPGSFTGNDPWTISVSGTNSPSGIFSATACASTACSQNSSTITIPPQVLIQVLYGEAHGQAVSGDTVSEPAIAASIQNRFNNSGFGSPTTWQAIVISSQYNGIATSITNGQQPELTVAVSAYDGVSSDIVAGSPCFFTPDSAGFAAIQSAFNSSATTVPTVNYDPRCYGSNRQLVWKTSIGNNIHLQGVPAFIFERAKVGSAAVVQIP